VPENQHYGAQTKARKAALDILYSAELRGDGMIDRLRETRSVSETPVRDLTTTIVHGVAAHVRDIDRRIESATSDAWSIDRMPAVDRALARIAVFEIDHSETPDDVAIAEAVRLAGDLSTDDSPAFLNGLLAQVKATKTKPNDD